MKYSIIYADPAWSYSISSSVAGGRGQNTSYRCLRPVEIYDMPIETLSADNSVLFLWASYPMLPEALYCIKAWGFFYKTNAFTWIKGNRKADSDFFGMGQWTRRNSEVCLLATKGNPKAVDHSISELVYSPIGKHSEKPPEIRDLIVKLCGDLPRIELFARQRAAGWDVFGNEVEGSIRLPTPLALDGGDSPRQPSQSTLEGFTPAEKEGVMLHPNFCTTVSPEEYDVLAQWEVAVKDANKFHGSFTVHEDCPPPYYTFDYGKLYGLVKYYADIKAAEQSMHLTDGTLRDFLVSATPEQLSALKDLLTLPIGR